jgi:hypothetical protein
VPSCHHRRNIPPASGHPHGLHILDDTRTVTCNDLTTLSISVVYSHIFVIFVYSLGRSERRQIRNMREWLRLILVSTTNSSMSHFFAPFTPNHVNLINACYPSSSALLASGSNFQPQQQELSRLTYYASNKAGLFYLLALYNYVPCMLIHCRRFRETRKTRH